MFEVVKRKRNNNLIMFVYGSYLKYQIEDSLINDR